MGGVRDPEGVIDLCSVKQGIARTRHTACSRARMAVWIDPSPFGPLRRTRRDLAASLTAASVSFAHAPHPHALRDGLHSVCDFSRLLGRLATVEDAQVFPRLERWFGQSARWIRTVRQLRVKLEAASALLLGAMAAWLADPSVARFEGIRRGLAAVTVLFHDWVAVAEVQLFARFEPNLGLFAARMLGGELELSLARR